MAQSLSRIEVRGIKYTQKQLKELTEALMDENDLFRTTAVCSVCGKHLPDSKFYKNYDPRFKSGKIMVCKDCIRKILYRVSEDGQEHEPTKESIIEALKIMNKPFVNSIYENAVVQSKSSVQFDLAMTYMRLMSNAKQDGVYADSDFLMADRFAPIDVAEAAQSDNEEVKEVQKQLKTDREDVIRLIGYDPFVHEDYMDQPFLYSQLLGILDSSDDSSEDQMKIQSSISIVRSFLQVSKIDDFLVKIMKDPVSIQRNATEINRLQDSKGKIQSGITKLAAESCISLKNAKGNSKGDNTWTGKIKKCKDIALRAAENNGYDLKTCKGMQQCADISSQAILKALKLDESDYSDMLAQQREMLKKLEMQCAKAEETARILLRENLDLKDCLLDNGIEFAENLVKLDSLLSAEDSGNEDYSSRTGGGS